MWRGLTTWRGREGILLPSSGRQGKESTSASRVGQPPGTPRDTRHAQVWRPRPAAHAGVLPVAILTLVPGTPGTRLGHA